MKKRTSSFGKSCLKLEGESRFIRKQMDIAAQIDTFLRQTNWTQKNLAAESGLRPSQISQLLSGDANPTIKTIVAIEEALGKDVIVCPEFLKKTCSTKGGFVQVKSWNSMLIALDRIQGHPVPILY